MNIKDLTNRFEMIHTKILLLETVQEDKFGGDDIEACKDLVEALDGLMEARPLC